VGALAGAGVSARAGGGRVLRELEGLLGVRLSVLGGLAAGEGNVGGVDGRWAVGGELGTLVHLVYAAVGVGVGVLLGCV
jgi:hypothetical protein